MFEICTVLAVSHFIWQCFVLLADCDGPMVVVISGSMEPHFYRGDVLVTYNRNRNFKVGDIISYKLNNREIPIVHRIVEIDHR